MKLKSKERERESENFFAVAFKFVDQLLTRSLGPKKLPINNKPVTFYISSDESCCQRPNQQSPRIVSDHKYFWDVAQVLDSAKPGGQVHWIPATIEAESRLVATISSQVSKLSLHNAYTERACTGEMKSKRVWLRLWLEVEGNLWVPTFCKGWIHLKFLFSWQPFSFVSQRSCSSVR